MMGFLMEVGMSDLIELLKSICEQQVLSLMNKCEWNTYPKYRKVADYEIRLMEVCLWHTNLFTSSKRRYLAEKLQKIGLLEIVKRQKHSPICIRFIDEKYNKMAFDLCEKSLVGFDYLSGNGWNSYPQYTRLDHGKSEVKRISELLFIEISNDFNLMEN